MAPLGRAQAQRDSGKERSFPRSWLPGLLGLVLLAALIALTFGRAVGFGFVLFDDNLHVTENPWVANPRAESWKHLLGDARHGMYVPASYALYWFESWLGGGPDPRVFHGVSLALHTLAAALVALCLRRVGASRGAALAGALLFALHPLQVESVAWISEQRGLLATCLGLVALERFLVRAAPGAPRAGLVRDFGWAFAAFALALLAKPSAAAFPAVALTIGLLVLRARGRVLLVWVGSWSLLALACVVWSKSLQPSVGDHSATALLDRPLVALDALAFYFQKLFVPVGLVADHGRRPELVLASPLPWLGPLLLVAALATICALPRVRRCAGAPLAIFIAALLPVLGLVPFGYQTVSTVADRYAYLALLGPALFVARVHGAWGRRAIVPIALLLAACTFTSARILPHWRNSETLFTRVLEFNPKSSIAHQNLGAALQAQGDAEGARLAFERAIAARPDHPKALNNLAILESEAGDLAAAEGHLRRALGASPGYARAHANLASVLHRRGRSEEALHHARTATELDAEDAQAHGILANLLFLRGDAATAIEHYERALGIDPGSVTTRLNLARALASHGDLERASVEARRVLELQPNSAAARSLLRTLGER